MHIQGAWFKDDQGRTLILRGVNLGGSSKVPFGPNGATHIREGFFDHRHVSFVGRPFPLDEADEHFSRLRAWGFTFLRFLVTWEAIEHAGPGQYDTDYLDYVYEVVRRAGEHGLTLFIDPHQDVWSRLCGGDGAPGWTLEAVGIEPRRVAETGAAIVHALHGDPFPRMIWPTNSQKLAAATLFTLFFGGDDLAPATRIDGEPVQGFLQRHYLGALCQLARRLQGLPHVVGYDTMNEPSTGWIGCRDLTAHQERLRLGAMPTPFQAMLLGAGFAQEVEVWSLGLTGFKRKGTRRVNPTGARLWQEGRPCVWQENGVWDVDEAGQPRLLRPDHFSHRDGRPIDFHADYLAPFARRFAREIRAIDPHALLFLESPPQSGPFPWDPAQVPNAVHAAHWYDGLTLMTKRYWPFLGAEADTGKVVFGRRRVRRSFAGQLAHIQAATERAMGGIPTLLGEFGIPFDLNGGRAYRTGDFSDQVQALDDTFQALEAHLLSGTLWNYTADNDNTRGDQWNGEDLSIFSRDQQADPGDLNSGGRALEAAVRPYAARTAGEPLAMSYDPRRRTFTFSFRHDPDVSAPTEIYLPTLHYPRGCAVEVSDGEFEIDAEAQVLRYTHSRAQSLHHLTIRPAS